MTIMSKSSQQAPSRKPDPLAQYPERYSQEESDHQERYRRLTAAGHKVWMWKNDPPALRDYEKATAGNVPKTDDEKHKEMAERKKDIEYERDHGEMRPKPDQYAEEAQAGPATIQSPQTSQTIAGHEISLEPGRRYWAGRKANDVREDSHDVHIYDIDGKKVVHAIQGLPQTSADKLVAAFNTGRFGVRVWPKPEQYGETGQTETPKPKDDPPEEESEETREMRRLGGSRNVSPWGRNSPQPAMPLRGGVR